MAALPSPLQPNGRGARSNDSGRFEALRRETFDDGWTELDAEPRKLRTTLHIDRARRIIATNDSPDIGFDQSINPYRGCEHGCIYCYARPSHAYLGHSPGLDFESQIYFKPDAAALLERELRRKGYQPRPIHIGGNTDPYQPVERELRLTRQVIEVLDRFNHPFSIITKNAMITRDLDLYAGLAERRLVRTAVSITTLDRRLARAMEPRAATPERRLEAVRMLAAAGVPCFVSVAPIIPGLNDHEIEAILERAAEAGAAGTHFTVLRLPLEIKDLFREWLESERPERAQRVMSLVRQMRGGKDYDAQWNTRMKGEGPVAEMIAARFRAAVRRFGLDHEDSGGRREDSGRGNVSFDVGGFRVPPAAGDQLDLFLR
jgi:DNA repair photolyase